MHELSIIMSIVDIAEKQMQCAEANTIEQIELEIGALSGVEMSSFDFAWPVAVRETVLESAERVINHIEGRGRCNDCKIEFTMTQVYDGCPNCNNHLIEIISGKQLRVKSLIVN